MNCRLSVFTLLPYKLIGNYVVTRNLRYKCHYFKYWAQFLVLYCDSQMTKLLLFTDVYFKKFEWNN